jgi:hypothetical protein
MSMADITSLTRVWRMKTWANFIDANDEANQRA